MPRYLIKRKVIHEYKEYCPVIWEIMEDIKPLRADLDIPNKVNAITEGHNFLIEAESPLIAFQQAASAILEYMGETVKIEFTYQPLNLLAREIKILKEKQKGKETT